MGRPLGSKNKKVGEAKTSETKPKVLDENGNEVKTGTIKGFDLNTFTEVDKEFTYTIPNNLTWGEVESIIDAMSLEDKENIAKSIEMQKNRAAAREAAKVDSGISMKTVNAFVNMLRVVNPRFKIVVPEGISEEQVKELKKNQTAEIYKFVQSQPAMIESLKLMALSENTSDDEDEDDDEDTEE